MQNFFRNNRGPFFAPDAVGSSTSPGASQASLGASGGGDPEMTAMFNQGMAQQKAMYMQSMQQAQQKNELQTQGDAALKTLKAVQIS